MAKKTGRVAYVEGYLNEVGGKWRVEVLIKWEGEQEGRDLGIAFPTKAIAEEAMHRFIAELDKNMRARGCERLSLSTLGVKYES